MMTLKTNPVIAIVRVRIMSASLMNWLLLPEPEAEPMHTSELSQFVPCG
jgi:hypothetical protein